MGSRDNTGILPLPSLCVERVAIDHHLNVAYVDARYAGEPLFLTWLRRNQDAGTQLTVKQVGVDELAKLREGGLRAYEDIDVDMVVRSSAIEYLRKASQYGASDVHLMMRGKHTEIQVVIKGEVRVLAMETHAQGEALARAIYQGLAKTRDSSYNPLEFQNAQIPGDELPNDIGISSVRIVRGPCYPQAHDGAFLTMRLQYATASGSVKAGSNELPQLKYPRAPEGQLMFRKMGFTEAQVEKLKDLMETPNGVIIFTGPTGSGKTTAMYEALKDIARTKPYSRLVTVEDPVEYPMEWAVQMAVTGTQGDAQTGAAFSERVRVALRMAPNLILLGELRGPDVASAAMEAAMTGHQVWTTMHVTDPFLFVERLEMMDSVRLHRKVFCDNKVVRGVVGVRLLPKLCPYCSVPLKDNPKQLPTRLMSALETWGSLDKARLRGPGCPKCGNDGTVGRFTVAEVVVTTPSLMKDFTTHGSVVARDNYRKIPANDRSMLESAIQYALHGLIDPRAIAKHVDVVEPKEQNS